MDASKQIAPLLALVLLGEAEIPANSPFATGVNTLLTALFSYSLYSNVKGAEEGAVSSAYELLAKEDWLPATLKQLGMMIGNKKFMHRMADLANLPRQAICILAVAEDDTSTGLRFEALQSLMGLKRSFRKGLPTA